MTEWQLGRALSLLPDLSYSELQALYAEVGRRIDEVDAQEYFTRMVDSANDCEGDYHAPI